MSLSLLGRTATMRHMQATRSKPMTAYALTLRLLAVGVFGVSLVHIVFGVGSEPFLGSGVSAASQLDPNLDSQNRFYGAAFSLFGVVFWIASSDLERYRRLLELALLVFFLAGATRLISIVIIGWPIKKRNFMFFQFACF